MPDALICYPGSIEKLKLLGATYLLTYLLPYNTFFLFLFEINSGKLANFGETGMRSKNHNGAPHDNQSIVYNAHPY
jgi:hypothetical protein